MGALYDSGLDENDPVITGMKIGSVVAYKLKSSDLPTNPNKVWLGVVIKYDDTYIAVKSLEQGYENLMEYVTYEQVIGIDSRT